MAAALVRVWTGAGKALSMTARGQFRVHYRAYFDFCLLLLALLCHNLHCYVITGTIYGIAGIICSVLLCQHWHYHADFKLYVLS